jgi:hypothetical protein
MKQYIFGQIPVSLKNTLGDEAMMEKLFYNAQFDNYNDFFDHLEKTDTGKNVYYTLNKNLIEKAKKTNVWVYLKDKEKLVQLSSILEMEYIASSNLSNIKNVIDNAAIFDTRRSLTVKDFIEKFLH